MCREIQEIDKSLILNELLKHFATFSVSLEFPQLNF